MNVLNLMIPKNTDKNEKLKYFNFKKYFFKLPALSIFILGLVIGLWYVAFGAPTQVPPGGNPSIAGGWILSGSNLYASSTSWNVGIGTTGPNQKLSIAGTLGILEGGTNPTYYTIFQGGDQTANITYTLPTSVGSSGQVLTTNGAGVLSWATSADFPSGTSGQTLRHNGTNWVADSLLFNNGTNVGIGTTNPGQKLDVAGNAAVSGNFILGGGTTASELRLLEPSGSGTNYTAFKAQAQAADVSYTLPAADGTNGQVLKTDGSGNLSWGSASGDIVFADAPNSDHDIASTSDVTIFTKDVPNVTAGDQIIVEADYYITQNTGAGIQYTFTISFGNVNAVIADAASVTSGTTLSPKSIRGVLGVTSTAKSGIRVTTFGSTSVADGGAADITTTRTRMLVQTTTVNLTGNLTVAFKVRSLSTTATQTLRLISYRISKIAQKI